MSLTVHLLMCSLTLTSTDKTALQYRMRAKRLFPACSVRTKVDSSFDASVR